MAQEVWKPLFDGKTLDGWVQRGGDALYRVEEGAIVGTSKLETPNSFLCTVETYSNFILEYEFKIDSFLNSGVQFRSAVADVDITIPFAGKEIRIPKGIVYGYQSEIDPEETRDRWWTAGVFDEARRGWLFPGSMGGNAAEFSKNGKAIYQKDGWNHVRIEAIGPAIRTALNGKPRVDMIDFLTPSGFIALQVHSISNETHKDGTEVRWKNLRIQEVEPQPNSLSAIEQAAGWKLLWDGKTSDGWRSAKGDAFPSPGWEIKDGNLTIHETGGGESASAGDIITREKFTDFELQLEFKITAGANSGIKIFVDPELNKGPGSSIGPEFQILDDAKHPDAKLGRDGNRTVGSLYDMIPAPSDKQVQPVGEWNHARIRAEKMRITFWLNGRKTLSIVRGSQEWKDWVAKSKYTIWPAFGELPEGHILLQDHGNETSFRSIKLLDLAEKAQ